METIFDYNPTPEELKYLRIRSKEEYFAELQIVEQCDKKAGADSHSRDATLVELFLYRGDKRNAEKYLSRFAPKDSVERTDFFRHCNNDIAI